MFALDRVSGVLVALATPLNRDGSVDEPSITRLVEHVLAGGVHGLLPLGSTGEGAALDEAARRRVLSAVVEAGAGRVPVICGVAQASVASVRTEIESAARLGADAVLVAPPFYYPMDQASVLAFYRRIAEAAPVPILVYNIPQFTKVVVDAATSFPARSRPPSTCWTSANHGRLRLPRGWTSDWNRGSATGSRNWACMQPNAQGTDDCRHDLPSSW